MKIFNPIILTTLPHFAAAYYAYQINILYGLITFISSTLSVIWHLYYTNKYLFYLDYSFALFWFLAELILALQTKNLFLIFIILALNATVAISNQIRFQHISYRITHSIWHCVSWSKAIFVAYLLVNA